MSSESTIEDLKAALRDLGEKRRRINSEYRALLTALRYFEGQEGSSQGDHSDTLDIAMGGTSRLPEAQSRRSREESHSGNTSNQLRDAIYEILRTERPLRRLAIAQRLRERGVTIPGRNPINNLGAHLSLDPRFISVRRGVWDLADPGADTHRSDWGSESRIGEEQDESDVLPW